MRGSENMACARIAPAQQPRIWIRARKRRLRARQSAAKRLDQGDTAGLKWAPLTGPKSAIKVARTATVAPGIGDERDGQDSRRQAARP
jgi:hypothetical protein